MFDSKGPININRDDLSNEKKEFRFQYKATLYIDISDKDIRNDLMIEVHNRCPVSKLLKTENITINNKKAH